jgi:hypothetical protein
MVDLNDRSEWATFTSGLDDLPWITYPVDWRNGLHPAGPPILDVETISRLHSRLEAGALRIDGNWNAAALAVPMDVFADIFAAAIDAELAEETFQLPIDVRIGALVRTLTACMEIDADRANLDEVAAAERAASHGVELDDLVKSTTDNDLEEAVLSVKPARLAELIDVTTGMLADWRSRKVGPHWVQLSNRRDSIRYSLVDVLDWIVEREQATDTTEPRRH